MEIQRITPVLGAKIIGVDLSKPLSNADFDAVHDAFVSHSVLIFSDQNLSAQNMIDFSNRFGPLMIHVLKDSLLEGYPEIYKLSNRRTKGKSEGRAYAGQYWHSDLTYEPRPSLGSLLWDRGTGSWRRYLFASTAYAFETCHLLSRRWRANSRTLVCACVPRWINRGARNGDP